MKKSYSELILLPTIEERYEYLRIGGSVGRETFGCNRYVNQKFYTSVEWRRLRRDVIVRDQGLNLGVPGFELQRNIIVHHIIPITLDDILEMSDLVLSMDNAICCSPQVHRAIHYGDISLLPKVPIERRPGDTVPWRQRS